MKLESWCLVWDDANISNYKAVVNLALIALRLCAEQKSSTPFIKYRFCLEQPKFSSYLEETMTTNYATIERRQLYDRDSLDEANEVLSALLRMDEISTRTHNALYFLFRGLHNVHWSDSFLMIMTSLESLFSKDKAGGAIKAVTSRVASLLDSRSRCTIADIESLYDIRSRLVHGHFDARADQGKNLEHLAHLEYVASQCFRELLRNDKYEWYSSKEKRDRFMGTLNTAPPGARIIYALPDVAVFKKCYNKHQFFDDIYWGDWAAAIDGFEQRFEKWYFEHMLGGHASYLDFCALCALVEVFSNYESDRDWHEPKNYREFLRRLDSVFRTRLNSSIVTTRWEAGSWKEGKLRDFADVFYAGVRCSLHHHGDLASFAGMHVEHGERKAGELAVVRAAAGKSLCGSHEYPLVVFNPAELKSRLRKWFHDYCNDLRRAPLSARAGQFRKKFMNDFGITIPIPAPNQTDPGDASAGATGRA
ncbi:MAG: hypothetical protein GY719_07905 [bacterium]|nr:hypothetical protein [bacterium]